MYASIDDYRDSVALLATETLYTNLSATAVMFDDWGSDHVMRKMTARNHKLVARYSCITFTIIESLFWGIAMCSVHGCRLIARISRWSSLKHCSRHWPVYSPNSSIMFLQATSPGTDTLTKIVQSKTSFNQNVRHSLQRLNLCHSFGRTTHSRCSVRLYAV